MTNQSFNELLNDFYKQYDKLQKEKKNFAKNVIEYFDKKEISINCSFISNDAFFISVPSHTAKRIPIQILCDFCNEFQCDLCSIYNDEFVYKFDFNTTRSAKNKQLINQSITQTNKKTSKGDNKQ